MRTVGLDLGGTNIKVAVVDDQQTIAKSQIPTHASLGPKAVSQRLAEAAFQAVAEHGPLDALGITVPGPLNLDAGTIRSLTNLPGDWADYPIVAELHDATGLPTFLINDARAFVLAEFRHGAGRGARQMLGVTLGTGIGGGFVLDGEVYFGPGGVVGEIGHVISVPVDGPLCGCGNRGCLESVATAHVLAAKAGQPTVADVFRAVDEGDDRAQAAVLEVANYLGAAIGSIVSLFVLDRVVVGGGIAQAGDHLMGPLRAAVREHASFWPIGGCEVVTAELGTTSGAIGAALWAAQHGQV